jgi:hypothetical protein
MKLGSLLATIATGVLAVGFASDVAVAQQGPLYGRVYSFHSAKTGGCPALDWHAVVESNGDLTGMISWDNMQHMARQTGKVNDQNHTFTATAKEIGGAGRTAHISGKIMDNGYLEAKITGTGTKCDGTTITVPWSQPSLQSQ